MSRHDPNRFYHCNCLDAGGTAHDDRFYHCNCIEECYEERKLESELEKLKDENKLLREALLALNETHCHPGCSHEGEGKEYNEAYRIANAKVDIALRSKDE